MSRWADEEIRELVTLWLMSTAAQIAFRLHRPLDAVRTKAKRLSEKGLLKLKAPRSRSIKPDRKTLTKRGMIIAAITTSTFYISVQCLKATASWRRSCIDWRKRPSKRGYAQGMRITAWSGWAQRLLTIGVILAAMPLTARQRNRLLFVERGHNVREITGAIGTVLRDSPGTSLAEIEQLLRAAASTAYLVATADGFEVIVGMKNWVAELDRLGRTPEQNRQALADRAVTP